MGGYFICNGLERIIRLLVQQRRHYVMGLRRSAYQKRGPAFSDVATLLRRARVCCRGPQSSPRCLALLHCDAPRGASGRPACVSQWALGMVRACWT